ncbi:spermidine/putrescine transport system permease protein [Angulomicrobium tetraedrale]|uniref:Spermidine/putrescine transport system permease protein n=1 Tax=Ancylobacter tetraedralis TaxID=217068 RepID=A0A839ZET9_9HYPH|nr:ABC transporter permease [Ancylobacter tetraedralis]MBB3773410.1 spermidine/putrescine transport system permease protein [Ancylobacter tetraedralis]
MKSRATNFLLILPGAAWLGVFLLLPCSLVLAYAFMTRGVYGGVVPTFSLDNFVRVFDAVYIEIFLTSARIALLAALVSLVIGYPAAYAISRLPGTWQLPALFFVILPFWSNYLIRTYAWIVLLNRTGVINEGLRGLGIIDAPLDILYTESAIVVGLVYNYLPFVILSVFSSIQRLNPEVLEASEDLGAAPWRTFLRVTLPLTMPGVVAGGVFVFVLSIGNFITPNLLGGGQVKMVGNVIYDQFTSARDWPFGAALSLSLIAIMMVLLVIQTTLSHRIRKIEKVEA